MDVRLVWNNHNCPEFGLAMYALERKSEIALHLDICNKSARCKAYQGHSDYKCWFSRHL